MESPCFEEVLPTLRMLCLLSAGEADARFANAKGCVTHIPNATFFSLPGLKHAECYFRSDLVLPHVVRFLATASPLMSDHQGGQFLRAAVRSPGAS